MKNSSKNSKGISGWLDKYFGEHVEVRMRMSRLVLLMVFIGLIADFFYNLFLMEQTGINLLTPLVGIITIIVSFWISTAIDDYEKIFFVLLFLANSVLFPIAFYYGGGFRSGESTWMLLGIVLVFLLLTGWRFVVCIICAVASTIAIYIISIKSAGSLSIPVSIEIMTLASLLSLITIALILGILYKYQNAIYKNQKQIAEERAREIADSAASQSLFFANMSHEIRTPINTIIGLNEMILREDVSDEIAENALNIQNASRMLLTIINDILDLSKIESGKMDIVPVQYETATLLSDIVNIVWIKANHKKLDFKIDIAEDIPSMLYGDEVRIKQVLTNILNNAVKYTKEGSVTLSVSGEQIDNNIVRLKMIVEDTGIGIRKEDIGNLFTVFKRVDQQTTTKIEGTGLGLAITKQLVDMMGGSIKVDSIYQKGSAFTVILDQEIVDKNPLGNFHYSARNDVKNRNKYVRSFEAPNARVLVVDDNDMNLMVAKKLLRETKVQVDLASSGQECLDKTLENKYHVILMDHLMPQMDGEETLGRLRSRTEGYNQKVPVIALTANVMANAQSVYQRKGFDGYLAKPISGSLLEGTLLKYLPSSLVEYSEEPMPDETAPDISSGIHKKKKPIQICTDSIADLPQNLMDSLDIDCMYVYVVTEEGRFIDRDEIFSGELLEYLANGGTSVSKVASVEEFEQYFADKLTRAEQVIYITMASGSSVSFENAFKASESFDNVLVINSGHLSCGMGIMVLAAAKMAQDGAGVDDIMYKLSEMRDKVSTSFIVPNTQSMYHSGKVSKRLHDISKALHLHPVLGMRHDKISLFGARIGTMEHASLSYIQSTLRLNKRIDDRVLFIAHAGLDTNELEKIKEEALVHKKFQNVFFQEASATVSSNCGLGTFGLIYIRK